MPTNNYFNELKSIGLSYSEIAKQTGINRHKISEYARGVRELKTGTDYFKGYNLTRKTAYKLARTGGYTRAEARKKRTTLLKQEKQPEYIIRNVKAMTQTTRFQLRILGLFRNRKTKTTQTVTGWSNAHVVVDNKTMLQEAIREAQSKLGGSNWELIRILDIEITEYHLKT